MGSIVFYTEINLVQDRQGTTRRVQRWVLRMTKGLDHLSFEERLRDLSLFSLEKRQLKGCVTNIHSTLSVGSKRMGQSLCNSAQLQDKGQQTQVRKFHLNRRKNLFTVRVTEHWNRLSREILESPLKVLKPAWMQTCATCSR